MTISAHRTGRFAVLDFETTALEPGTTGRALEVGIVVLDGVADADGMRFRRIDEWETLLHPGAGVDVGATHIHRIVAADVEDAPRFADVIGDVLQRLSDAVVVAHNAAFDLRFLDYECVLANRRIPRLATVCTRDLARSIAAATGERAESFRLEACLERAGIPFPELDQHRALGDARATAALFASLMERAHGLGLEVRCDVGPSPLSPPPVSGRAKTRPDTARPTLEARDNSAGRGMS